jgi:putative ABC transport system ATP-binding protein/lipoprotein-releasing system ATP-binding protein
VPEPLVSARNIGKTYRSGRTSVTALVSATCEIAPRARIAVTGPSGSGKSTLLYLLGGIEAPTSGSIAWPALGSVERLRPGLVALVFQSPCLLAPLNAVENVEVPLLMRGTGKDRARQAALAALERVGLLDIAEAMPENLSGGQAARIAAARALASGAQLILADEPTGKLDHPTASRLFDAFFAALEGTDAAMVVATHDQSIAGRMRDVWQLKHGLLNTSPP